LRSRLAGRKVLMVLDDAGSVDQVAPLLPGRPGSAVMVTSRSALAGISALYGGDRLQLEPLSPRHSYRLLARIAGARRCEREETAVTELAALCGRLPLALRVASANLASRPSLEIAQYAADLRTGDRMAKLRTRGESGLAVRAAFDMSYRALDAEHQRAFCLLGLVPGQDVSTAAAAATDRLREENWDTDGAFRRFAEWYLYSIHAAVSQCLASIYISQLESAPADIFPLAFTADEQALEWLGHERPNYLALIERAAQAGLVEYTWRITDAARPDLLHSYRMAELERVASLGLSCAQDVGERRGEAMMWLTLGALKGYTSRGAAAITDLAECRHIAGEIGEMGIVATAVISCAALCVEAGQPVSAIELAEEALAVINRGVEQEEARRFSAMGHLAEAYRLTGRLSEAREMFELSLRYARMPMRELVVRCALGNVFLDIGEYQAALDQFTRVLNLSVFVHTAFDECTIGLALTHCEIGELDQAREYAAAALDRAGSTGYRKFEAEANIALGKVHQQSGRPDLAAKCFGQARELALPLEIRLTIISATIGLAASSGDDAVAQEAISLARENGLRVLEARALVALARIQLAQARVAEAGETAETALAMFVQFGSRPGQADAEAVLAGCE
jgi:tetratricopeptide (TPR) repeat protein